MDAPLEQGLEMGGRGGGTEVSMAALVGIIGVVTDLDGNQPIYLSEPGKTS